MAAVSGRAWLTRALGYIARRGQRTARTGCESAFAFLQNDWLHGVTRSPACYLGSNSALGEILGVSKQETEDIVGQYPPPVSVSKAEQDDLLLHQPDQPENSRVLRVAIIGAPNAGKSTLSNQLLGRKVFPVSSKVHTTRCRAQGVITDGETQIVLLDTPGLISAVSGKRHNLEKSLVVDPWHSVKEADLVLVLVDISDHWTRNKLHAEVLKCLSKYPQLPAVLALNKVDLLKNKGLLLELTTNLTEGIVNNKKLKIKSRFRSLPQSSPINRNLPGKVRAGSKECGDSELRDAPIRESGAWDGTAVLQKDPPVRSRGDSNKSRTEAPGVSDGDSANGSGLQPEETETARHEGSASQHQASEDLKHRQGWPHFKEVFMLSAVNGDEVETLQRYLMSQAQPGPWNYHSTVLTDQSPQEICCNLIRERLLEYLPQEVPYNITQSTELWAEGPNGELRILQNITVARKNHAGLLIGQGGQLIGKIARDVGQDLMNVFLCDVQLKLCVKVKK